MINAGDLTTISAIATAVSVNVYLVRGVEVQTAEHLILASVLCPQRVLIVINKTDLVTRERVELLAKKLPKV